MTEKEALGFALKALKTEQFATFEENFAEGGKTELTTGLEFKLSKSQKQIGVYATFTFEQDGKAFIKIKVSCHFTIAPASWNASVAGDKIVFPGGFVRHLATITIGTARGVLHAKTEGTPFNTFILPTINVQDLGNKDEEFPLGK